ncbi:hypothetical protein GJ744_007859 [Endocarpon pusillum]|uniref:F-box domain-containing protein n=1 Tax=Endocarpon pusillum TaxID=364733 RepID=A0A8H7EA19_9EURO|nr:hypothetical protein GJ744_007859 [Endocarpon pusillum]
MSSSDPVEGCLENKEYDMDFVFPVDRLQMAEMSGTNAHPLPNQLTEQKRGPLQAVAAKDIVSSIHIGIASPSKEFGYTKGEQLVRFAQSGRIIIFSIAKEIFLSQGILDERILPSQQQQQQQPTQCTIRDMPDEIIAKIANSCEHHDRVCLALSNKHLAEAISWLNTCPAGGLSITAKWSPTTAVFKRQNLLKRLNYHQSSPRLRYCAECKMLRATDPAFWRKQFEQLDSVYKAHLYRKICSLSVISLQTVAADDDLERILLAWRDGIPALADSKVVDCPTCVAHHSVYYDGWWMEKDSENRTSNIHYHGWWMEMGK